ncbi:MAG: VapC toxin family PIN domain ribonuclease [Candidatus Latescibacteria bacterium]|nr:VapC toxin family PIN domain ribonuclease [Candidatus Latescibacterota bacterium]
MILVDTSVWINHLNPKDPRFSIQHSERLKTLLNDNLVLGHSMVIGELACGNLKDRKSVLTDLKNLPNASVATDDHVLSFIEQKQLMGRGIGYIDFHLLAATEMTRSTELWSLDGSLMDVATELNFAYQI